MKIFKVCVSTLIPLFAAVIPLAFVGCHPAVQTEQPVTSSPVQTGVAETATPSPAPAVSSSPTGSSAATGTAAQGAAAMSGSSAEAAPSPVATGSTGESGTATATGTSADMTQNAAPAVYKTTPAASGTTNHMAISVHFSGDNPDYAIDPQELAGVVSAQNWNNTPLESGTLTGLKDSSGTASSASMVFTSAGFLCDKNSGKPGSPFQKLYHSWLNSPYSGYPPAEGRCTAYFTGIPFKSYDVYVYVFTVGGSSDTYVYQGTDNAAIGPNKLQYTGDYPKTDDYTEGGDYVKFSGLSGPGQFFVISNGNNTEGTLNTEICGIEIVDTTGTAASAAASK